MADFQCIRLLSFSSTFLRLRLRLRLRRIYGSVMGWEMGIGIRRTLALLLVVNIFLPSGLWCCAKKKDGDQICRDIRPAL